MHRKLNKPSKNSEIISAWSMKFPKPKILEENRFPDYEKSNPDMMLELYELIYPTPDSFMDKYYHTSIEFLKNKKRDKEKKRKEKASKLYLADLNKKLYFIEADIWGTVP